MQLNSKDSSVLQELARRYAAAASHPVHQEKRQLWLKMNDGKMERPLVIIDQIPWHEMDVDGGLVNQVEAPYWRNVENWLRRRLYKWEHMMDDTVFDPFIALPRPAIRTGWGIQRVSEVRRVDAANDVVSQHYENQIQSMEDVERIQMPTALRDEAQEREIREQADRLFSGIIPYRLSDEAFCAGIWDNIASWMGVENCYLALMDDPDMIHALLEKMTQGLIGLIEQMNEQGLFDVSTNLCHCTQTYSSSLPGDDVVGRTSHDTWAYGMAQLFTSVSPAVTEEFEVAYMKRVFPYFGAIHYGCCDRLDDRLEIIQTMPNLKKISCSPWSDRENFAAKLDPRYGMVCKPSPVFVAGKSIDEEAIRADLRRSIAAARARGLNQEFILKDISTVSYRPQHLWRWCEIAMQEICR